MISWRRANDPPERLCRRRSSRRTGTASARVQSAPRFPCAVCEGRGRRPETLPPCASERSSSVRPPSGPTSSMADESLPATSAMPALASGSSRMRVPPEGKFSRPSASDLTGSIVGSHARPHCSAAATAMACQCFARRAARSSSSRTTLRSQDSGTIRATPSSVAFWMTRSMRCARQIPCSRMAWRGDSGRVSTASPTLSSRPAARLTDHVGAVLVALSVEESQRITRAKAQNPPDMVSCVAL